MIVSQNDAKRKYCWVSMSSSTGPRLCEGEKCMGWDWYKITENIGYCKKGNNEHDRF